VVRCAGLLGEGARRAAVHGVRCEPVRDRLAVWTYVEAGEEIPCGDPSVTDAERAAAGRETLAQRWRELLEPNRRRAAGQYAAGPVRAYGGCGTSWQDSTSSAMPSPEEPIGARERRP
jgi:hypothetical protein